jgi:hypothetical protein
MAQSMRHGIFSIVMCVCSTLVGCGGGGGWQPPISVSVTRQTVQTTPGAAVDFKAVVSGTRNTEVTWSVQEGPAGGAIVSFGRYLAPKLAGTYHVVATSKADPSKSGQATVTVGMVLVKDVERASVNPNKSRQFTAALLGASNPAVNWSVQEGASGGTITQDGLYTAPGTTGTYHVVIVSQAIPQQTATITITVAEPGPNTFPIPNTFP